MQFKLYTVIKFGKVLMLGEFMSNELSGASICSGLMKKSSIETSFFFGKSHFETSTSENTWSILIGQKSKSLTRTR